MLVLKSPKLLIWAALLIIHVLDYFFPAEEICGNSKCLISYEFDLQMDAIVCNLSWFSVMVILLNRH